MLYLATAWEHGVQSGPDTSHFLNYTLVNTRGGLSRLDTFNAILSDFFIAYYHPVTPQSILQNLWFHHPSSPYYIPHQSSEEPEDQ